MSMSGNYVRLTSAQLDALRAEPDSIAEFLYPNGGAAPPSNHLDIERAWNAIHFLLNGEELPEPGAVAPPLLNVVYGGEEIGEDIGYGSARFLLPQQVRELADALQDISADEI